MFQQDDPNDYHVAATISSALGAGTADILESGEKVLTDSFLRFR